MLPSITSHGSPPTCNQARISASYTVGSSSLSSRDAAVNAHSFGVRIIRGTKKKPKSTLLADNIRGLITTKQTKPRPVASAAPHSIRGNTADWFPDVEMETLYLTSYWSHTQYHIYQDIGDTKCVFCGSEAKQLSIPTFLASWLNVDTHAARHEWRRWGEWLATIREKSEGETDSWLLACRVNQRGASVVSYAG